MSGTDYIPWSYFATLTKNHTESRRDQIIRMAGFLTAPDGDYGNLHVLTAMVSHALEPLTDVGWRVEAVSLTAPNTAIAGP